MTYADWGHTLSLGCPGLKLLSRNLKCCWLRINSEPGWARAQKREARVSLKGNSTMHIEKSPVSLESSTLVGHLVICRLGICTETKARPKLGLSSASQARALFGLEYVRLTPPPAWVKRMLPATRPRRKKTRKMESESELSLLVENFWSDDESIGLKRNKAFFHFLYWKYFNFILGRDFFV